MLGQRRRRWTNIRTTLPCDDHDLACYTDDSDDDNDNDDDDDGDGDDDNAARKRL